MVLQIFYENLAQRISLERQVITRLARNLICTILKLKYAGIKFHEFRGLTVNE